MRKLDRSRIAIPKILSDPMGVGAKEKELMIAYYSKKRPTGPQPKFNAYGNAAVKQAVSELSHMKCAYCESFVLAIDDGDVEHFRPKGEIKDQNVTAIKPGYYWLGSNWDNLFLSCGHCNQERKRPTPNGQIKATGKKNQFPLSDGSKRIRTHKRDISEEEPYRLLINPCKEDPMRHIEFDHQGVISAKMHSNKADKKGEVSIWVFALSRSGLTHARMKHASTLLAALKTYEDLENELDSEIKYLSPRSIKLREKTLSNAVENLKVYTREDQLFSAMSINIITNFLAKRGVKYKP